MKKIITIFALIGALRLQSFARPVKRITFKKGATKTVVTGYLKGYKDEQVYLIKVRAGQVLRVEAEGLTVSIRSPKGETFFKSDLSCHSDAETTEEYSNRRKGSNKTVAGDYKIIVNECLKADSFKGSFKLKVWVK